MRRQGRAATHHEAQEDPGPHGVRLVLLAQARAAARQHARLVDEEPAQHRRQTLRGRRRTAAGGKSAFGVTRAAFRATAHAPLVLPQGPTRCSLLHLSCSPPLQPVSPTRPPLLCLGTHICWLAAAIRRRIGRGPRSGSGRVPYSRGPDAGRAARGGVCGAAARRGGRPPATRQGGGVWETRTVAC